jgi:protein-tyrosine phosphatase
VIDLHTHILPNVDDGPRFLVESLEMARVAVADGITHLAATPHSGHCQGEDRRAWVTEQVSRLQAELDAAGIPLSLVPGAEVYITRDLLADYQARRVFPLNGSRYMLVELPFHDWPDYTDSVLLELLDIGITPIMAHPERNSVIQADPGCLFDLVSRGLLTQVNGASLLGENNGRARNTARLLIEHNLAHILASDSHHARHRPPVLSPAVRVAAEIVGEEAARAMVVERPQAILNNQVVQVPRPIPIKPK